MWKRCRAKTKFNGEDSLSAYDSAMVIYGCQIYWTGMDFTREMRVKIKGEGLVYIFAMVLYNISSCLYPYAVLKYFSCFPSTLD